MNYWITSDTHYGHANIIRYYNRPFKDVDHMNKTLIRNHNERVKPFDVLYHLGDFCFKNSTGGKKGEGTTTKANDYLDKLNGRIVFVRGNHDKNNGLKVLTESIMIKYGGRMIHLVHDPADAIPLYLNLCGHVHEEWKHKIFNDGAIPTVCINVGVDVWDYRPVKLEEVIKYYDATVRE